jgi:hypothetical protein
MKDYIYQVKLTEDKSKYSSSCILFLGLTYIYVFELLIHEVLKFVLIISLNIIFTTPLLFIEEINPVHAWFFLNLV